MQEYSDAAKHPSDAARRAAIPAANRSASATERLLRLQRAAGNQAVTKMLNVPPVSGQRSVPSGSNQDEHAVVQRALVKHVAAPGWGGSNDGSFDFNPYAEITIGGNKQARWFQESPVEEVEVYPGATGAIVIHNPFWYTYHEINTVPGMIYGTNTTHVRSSGGPIECSVTATFSVDKDGKVVIGPLMKSGIVGFPAVLDGSIDNSAKQDGQDEGQLNISTVLKSTKTISTGITTGTESSTGGDIKPLGVGFSTGGKTATSSNYGVSVAGSGVWMATYGIALRVKRKPPIPAIGKISFNAEGKFLSGDDGIDGVNRWWLGIPDPVRRQIMLGKKPVLIYGNASKTGTSQRNSQIVANRLADVRGKLIALAGRMDIASSNTGSVGDERSVVIEVRYTEDEATAVTP